MTVDRRGFLLRSAVTLGAGGAMAVEPDGQTVQAAAPLADALVAGGLRCAEVTLRTAAADDIVWITPRQREVVQLIAEGKSNREIGIILNITEKTAETHRANVMRRLNLHSVSEIVRYAVRNDVIQA